MGDFNHRHIQWKSLEITGGEDQQFIFLIQESFFTQHVSSYSVGTTKPKSSPVWEGTSVSGRRAFWVS